MTSDSLDVLPATKHTLNGPNDNVFHSQGMKRSITNIIWSGVVISVNNIIELKIEIMYLLLQVHFNEKCHGLLRFWLRVLKMLLKALFNNACTMPEWIAQARLSHIKLDNFFSWLFCLLLNMEV